MLKPKQFPPQGKFAQQFVKYLVVKIKEGREAGVAVNFIDLSYKTFKCKNKQLCQEVAAEFPGTTKMDWLCSIWKGNTTQVPSCSTDICTCTKMGFKIPTTHQKFALFFQKLTSQITKVFTFFSHFPK